MSPDVINIVVLVIALFVILGAAELFTNGVEWLGQKLQLSEGVVGSVLAAVGTALPETLIPVVAVGFFGTHSAHEVGIGAIAGAPFMLSTLTLSLCGFSMWWFARQGKRSPEMTANKVVLTRDFKFFIIAYALALLGALVEAPMARYALALVLCLNYVFYLKKTFAHEGEVGEPPEHLHFDRLMKMGTSLNSVVGQVIVGLLGILGGAYLFVDKVQALSHSWNVPEVILSLLIAPVATELPEKVNSILWARQGKDTLAMGNITGALVFQSCFPVAFGVAFTEWDLGAATVTSGIVAICSASFFLFMLSRDKLRPQHLMLGGIAYAATLAWMMLSHQTH